MFWEAAAFVCTCRRGLQSLNKNKLRRKRNLKAICGEAAGARIG